MTDDPIVATLTEKMPSDLTWWENAALAAFDKGHHVLIKDREWKKPYLSRFWITTPKPRNVDGIAWESSNSVLLHYFHAPDDAGALHDHPWPFTTEVLSGGYREARPCADWTSYRDTAAKSGNINMMFGSMINKSPRAADTEIHHREVGDSVSVDCNTPHAVVGIANNTWTLVRTGEAYGHEWGFYPDGGQRVGWREYLNIKEVRP